MTNDRYLFRGFHKEENGKETIYIDGQPIKGKWVYGDLHQDFAEKHNYYIAYSDCNEVGDVYYTRTEVIPETAGQYTGLEDKNGKKIFEGDKVYYNDFTSSWGFELTGYVVFTQDCMFEIEYDDKYKGKDDRPLVCGEHSIFASEKIEVIGTKFDKEAKDND